MHKALNILASTFGYHQFRGQQQEIIQCVQNGEDALVLMPTGGGKSLCYQIPALIRAGTAIIVSPLIALMHDQVSALNLLGINAAYLNSSLSSEKRSHVIQQLRNKKLDLLYIAPERLTNPFMLDLLSQCEIALFAIDEAHCVSQWGHDFRPDYQKLAILHQQFPNTPRIALTATADQRTREEIIEQLALQKARVFISSFDRPNIHYTIQDGQNGRQKLWQFIQTTHPENAGIVYCLSRKKVESVAQWLSEQGRIALPYHAGLSDQQRNEHQERFLREEGIIIVATIAFGMGIDKPDVRFVAHLSLPKSVEAYYQETGRAGRDGEPADAWMAYGLQDVILLRQMLESSHAAEQYKRISSQKLEAMLGLCELTTCRRIALLEYFDEPRNEPCGNCDNCLTPPQTWDGLKAAQMALSCVHRTGQRFGVNYLINVLMAKSDTRIENNRHNQVSTWGIGIKYSANEWRSIYRQLLARGYLTTDNEGYGALQLTLKCKPVLKGEVDLQLRKTTSKKSITQRKPKYIDLPPQHMDLFNKLRTLRKQLADEKGVPSYVVFGDKSLREMATHKPTTEHEFLNITGVGEVKLESYGELFTQLIKESLINAEFAKNN
ncbi:MAG: DNA helicase RecQ [bacterium]